MKIVYRVILLSLFFGVAVFTPNRALANNICQAGIIAYWSFDDSTANDQSGNGYNGIMVHSPKPVQGFDKRGTALEFTGRGEYSDTTDAAEGDHILLPRIPFEDYDEFSISLWVNEKNFSQPAGEAYIYFGEHTKGWLGIMNHKLPDSYNPELYTQFSIGGTSDTSTIIKSLYDITMRNHWYQYVLVYNKGLMQCYRNGELIGTKYDSVKIASLMGAIGCHWWDYNGGLRSSARFTGAVDEVKIYCRALTQEEIEAESNPCSYADMDDLEIEECAKPQQNAIITLPQAFPNEEVSSAIHIKNISDHSISIPSIKLKNNDFYFDNREFPVLIAPDSTYELKIFFKKLVRGTYDDEFTLTDYCTNRTFNLTAEVIPNTTCQEGLIAYWSFDDSTAKDNSGNGYNGTIIHTPKPILGFDGHGTAFEFTGRGEYSLYPDTAQGDHILLPHIPFENYDEFSISMWVNEKNFSLAAGEAYIYFGEHTSGWLGIMNHKVPDSESPVLYSQYSISGNADTSTVVTALFDNDLRDTWRQYVIVYDKGLLKCYRNGVFVGERFDSVRVPSASGAIGAHWWQYYDGLRSSARFSGAIDEVKIYCSALPAVNIEGNYLAALKQIELSVVENQSTNSDASKYFFTLRSPRYSSTTGLVTVDFETNITGTPLNREVNLYNSLGDMVGGSQARVNYMNAMATGNSILRSGTLTFPINDLPSGVYFIKSENGVVGVVIGK